MVPELWVFDFDGTLAHRPGMWTQCLLDVLDTHVVDHGVPIEAIRPHLSDGFPWHRPADAHLELCEPDAWWSALAPVFERAFVHVGIDATIAPSLAAAVRERFCDSTQFQLFDDTVPALELARSQGARTVILSNHVPELQNIVDGVGLSPLIDEVFTSALIGYDKPHPETFRAALQLVPADRACMIGDNPSADIDGARVAGMNARLVRHADVAFASVSDAVMEVLTGPNAG